MLVEPFAKVLASLRDAAEYVVTGRRGTTTEVEGDQADPGRGAGHGQVVVVCAVAWHEDCPRWLSGL
jgi:hypothetical protein